MEQFEVVTSLTDQQVKSLEKLYQNVWWAKGRTAVDVQHILAHSLSVALVEKSTKFLVAYSRVVTDYLYFAHVFDVIVDQDFRGKNIGKMVVEAILELPELSKVSKIELKCLPELAPFYEKCGFSRPSSECITMHYVQAQPVLDQSMTENFVVPLLLEG